MTFRILFVSLFFSTLAFGYPVGSSTFQYKLQDSDQIVQYRYNTTTRRLTKVSHSYLSYEDFLEDWCDLDDENFVTCPDGLETDIERIEKDIREYEKSATTVSKAEAQASRKLVKPLKDRLKSVVEMVDELSGEAPRNYAEFGDAIQKKVLTVWGKILEQVKMKDALNERLRREEREKQKEQDRQYEKEREITRRKNELREKTKKDCQKKYDSIYSRVRSHEAVFKRECGKARDRQDACQDQCRKTHTLAYGPGTFNERSKRRNDCCLGCINAANRTCDSLRSSFHRTRDQLRNEARTYCAQLERELERKLANVR